jgi:hypothetical protein
MKRAIFFVLLLVMEPVSFSQNLVVNPGFEIWGKIDKPTDWTNTQGCQKDSVFVLSENYSCRQEGSTSSRDLGQKFVISPGKHYRFSFFYKTGTLTTGNGCRVWCEWLDENKNAIDDPLSEPVLHSGFMRSEEWKQFSAEITSPANAANFYLLVRTLPKSITYWDDFVFEENEVTYDPEEKPSGIMIYPNPAHDYLIINNIQNLQHINIQSLTGIIILSYHFSGEQTVTIPVSGLPDGLYIINIITSDKLITRKFIKKSN